MYGVKKLALLPLLSGLLLPLSVSALEREISVNLMEACSEDLAATPGPFPCASPSPGASGVQNLLGFGLRAGFASDPVDDKRRSCAMIRELAAAGTPPLEIRQKDQDGNEWKIRFNFGFARHTYLPTDMKLESSRLNVVIKDFEFQERTSAEYYDPRNWKQFQDAFRWIDEPTNTWAFSAEKKNNVLYLNVSHPKFLKVGLQDKHVTGTVDGVAVNQVMPINEPFDGYNNQPGQMHLTRFENTHKQMDWQIGYGRKFVVFDGKKAGQLSYTPQVFAGVTSGAPVSIYQKEGQYWDYDEHVDDMHILGANASVGQMLEYKRGHVGIYAAQKFTVSHYKQGFMDGKAEFDMKYASPITFGVTFDLATVRAKGR